MATQTFFHSRIGNCIVEIDVNDANWRISRIRATNQGTITVVGEVLKTGAQVFTAQAPPGQVTEWNVTGVQLGWDSVNGGLMMNDYELRVHA